MKTIKIGLVGFGTIGTGVAKLLLLHKERISRRTGFDVQLVKIVDTDLARDRGIPLPEGILSADYHDILNDPEVSIVVQLIGGTGIERTIMLEMLAAGKNIVTANKALLATHGEEIFEAARQKNASVAFEAAVGGGIPIIAAIAESLAANEIQSIHAILNGTCNFILSNMEEHGSSYASTLKEAQRLGYAEANPAMDVEGMDTAQKLAILSHIAFGVNPDWKQIPRIGIETVDGVDFRYANMLGYSIKLLAIARRIKASDGEMDRLELSVSPTLVSKSSPLGDVKGAFNAVSVIGDAVGHSFYYGLGAGEMPTASAVVADVIDTIVGRTKITFDTLELWNPSRKVRSDIQLAAPESVVGKYYLRVLVEDRAGVMAEVANALGSSGISIASLIQEGTSDEDNRFVQLIIMTHETTEGAVDGAVEKLSHLDCVKSDIIRMRIYDEK
ncbi:MAG: homoserine dehydrogenase [Planctomycetia bacterium]|nr:homoserine dehydrogenase [Planctomycetia bacterium]